MLSSEILRIDFIIKGAWDAPYLLEMSQRIWLCWVLRSI